MASVIDYNLTTMGGRDITALQNVIELRKKEFGETTKQACIAVAINCLQSLRQNTMVAKEGNIKLVIEDITSSYTPSWKKQGKFSVRIFRSGLNGSEIKFDKTVKVQWLVKASEMVAGVKCHTYKVTDKIASDKELTIVFVARSQKQAKDAMKMIHKKRVRRYKNLAKYALGVAMSKTSKEGAGNTDVNQITKVVANDNTKVSVQDTGFNNGDVHIHIEDKIDYATQALKDGAGYVDTAMQKALNKIMGNILHKLKSQGKITDSLKIPFPELKR